MSPAICVGFIELIRSGESARGGTRTRTPILWITDFKSVASAIPPPGHWIVSSRHLSYTNSGIQKKHKVLPIKDNNMPFFPEKSTVYYNMVKKSFRGLQKALYCYIMKLLVNWLNILL